MNTKSFNFGLRRRALKRLKNRIKADILKQKVPFLVCLSVTKKCNAKCKYCYLGDHEGDMPTKQILKLLDECSALGVEELALTGGEPLLREDIGKIIDYAKLKGLNVILSSNGSLVSKRINELKNLDILKLSFDGPEKIHDLQRGKGSYRKLMKGIKEANSKKIPLISLTILTKNNLGSLGFILEKAREYNFLASFFQPVDKTFFYENRERNKLLLPSKKEFKSAIKKLIILKKQGYPVGNSFKTLKFYHNGDKKYKCLGGKRFLHIHINGDVYPCWTPPKIKAINCLKSSLKEAMEKMPRFNCKYCNCVFSIESNYKYAFNLNYYVNQALNFLKIIK